MLASRIKQLSKDSLIYGLGGAAARSIGIILVPLYVRFFTPADYGVYGNLLSLSAFFTTLLTFGLDAATAIYYFERKEPQMRREITGAWLYTIVLISIPCCLLLLPISPLLSLLAGPNDSYSYWVILVAVNIPFVLLGTIFTTVLRLNFKAGAYAGLTVATAILNLLLTVLMVAVWGWGIPGTLIASLISSILSAIAGFVLTRHSYTARPNWVVLGQMLHIGGPMTVAGLAQTVNATASGFFLLHFASAADNGVLTIALRLSAIVAVAITAFQLAWIPYALSIASTPDANYTYAKILTYFVIGFGGFALMVGLFSREIMTILGAQGSGFASSYRVLGLLAYATILSGAYYITNIGSNITKKLTNVTWATLITTAGNIVLNLVLTPTFGIIGAALTNLVTNLLLVWLVYLFSQRHYPIPFEVAKVAATLAIGITLMLLGQEFSSGRWWLDIIVKLGIAALYLLSLPLLGIITRRELTIVQSAVQRRLR